NPSPSTIFSFLNPVYFTGSKFAVDRDYSIVRETILIYILAMVNVNRFGIMSLYSGYLSFLKKYNRILD
ncbi:MAG TPA: hypothetical protein DCO90_03585, partial [Sphingobacterium sp.]|nr:hypothetical protein [Sphingobacterium sp.]